MSETEGPIGELLGTVVEQVDRGDLLSGISSLLVACSGGGDSVVLVDVLERLAPRYGLSLVVAHLNHVWRGQEADHDARFVEELARSRGLRFVGGRAAPAPSSGSLEQHFRSERLQFLACAAADTGCDAVALGHTMDDQAETVLMNLARGTGRRGLGGIRSRARVEGLLLLRPLLGVRREDLRAYAAAAGLEWRDDLSNTDPRFLRNRIRMTVLPALAAAVPGAVRSIGRAAETLQSEETWLQGLAREALEAARVPGAAASIELDLEALERLPEPVLRRVLREALLRTRGDLRGIHLEHVEAVRTSVMQGVERARDMPGVRVSRERGVLRFAPLERRRSKEPASSAPADIKS